MAHKVPLIKANIAGPSFVYRQDGFELSLFFYETNFSTHNAYNSIIKPIIY